MESGTAFLKDELLKRIEANPSYSMRSFARCLGMNPGTLSSLINGKRALTERAALKVCTKLNYSPLQTSEVLRSLRASQAGSETWLTAQMRERVALDQDQFRCISDWYHYGILQLIQTNDYLKNKDHSRPDWLAQRLNISPTEAKFALERLMKLKLLRLSEDGFYRRTAEKLTVANRAISTKALRKLQEQIRKRAIWSLHNDPIEKRSMTSITMAIDPTKVSEAKKLIEEFEIKMSHFLESDEKKEVYQLSISLFPIKGEYK